MYWNARGRRDLRVVGGKSAGADARRAITQNHRPSGVFLPVGLAEIVQQLLVLLTRDFTTRVAGPYDLAWRLPAQRLRASGRKVLDGPDDQRDNPDDNCQVEEQADQAKAAH